MVYNLLCALIQREFFWPSMRSHIETYINSCDTCCRARFRATDTTHRWSKDADPWSRIHIDWAFHRAADNILVIADSSSGWLEAAVYQNRTTATVINQLRACFARFGVPNTVVLDNAPEFTCA